MLLEDPDWPIGWATLELELLEAEAMELLWEVAELLWEVPLPTWELRELEEAEDEELPPEKARRIRILSGIAFILLLVLVVWLVDIGFEFVKSLFVK